MFVSTISTGSNPLDYNPTNVQHSRMQQFRQEFQQLGHDLQSGNKSAVQTDFTALQQLRPQPDSSASAQGGNPMAQQFSQLSQALQPGNASTSQQDFTNFLQDFRSPTALFHHHPRRASGAGDTNATGPASQVSQLLNQLDQALQSGILSASQQAYTTLQRDLQQFLPGSASLPGAAPSGVSGVSVSA